MYQRALKVNEPYSAAAAPLAASMMQQVRLEDKAYHKRGSDDAGHEYHSVDAADVFVSIEAATRGLHDSSQAIGWCGFAISCRVAT